MLNFMTSLYYTSVISPYCHDSPTHHSTPQYIIDTPRLLQHTVDIPTPQHLIAMDDEPMLLLTHSCQQHGEGIAQAI
jgi:hypothetical protein